MRSAAVEVDLEVYFRAAELRDHGVELVHWRDRIFGAVQDKYAALDVFGSFRCEFAEGAMHGDEPEKRRARLDKFDSHRSSEAIANRGKFCRIDHRLGLEYVEPSQGARAHQ